MCIERNVCCDLQRQFFCHTENSHWIKQQATSTIHQESAPHRVKYSQMPKTLKTPKRYSPIGQEKLKNLFKTTVGTFSIL